MIAVCGDDRTESLLPSHEGEGGAVAVPGPGNGQRAAPALSLGAGLSVEKEGPWASQEQPILVAGVWLWDRRAC